MKRPLSLRTRLVGLTLLAVALVWLLTAFVTWREARHELEELLAHPPSTAAAHMAEERNEVAAEIAGQLLKPMLFALPALALLLVIAIGFALAPLRQLARDVAARAPDRLDPLPIETLPTEVAPLVARLNELFADIMRALENERRFTADAAHELRTPLAALKAQAQVALASVDAAERQHALDQILVGCDRATHLVAQLLTLARLDAQSADQMQDVALRPLAEEVLAMSAGEAIERHCDLVLRDGDAHVRGDATLLQVLLRNLVDNAIRHSGGSQVEVSIAQHGDRVVLSVGDNGCGIAADEREHVLQRFYRGTGVGAGDTATRDSSGSGLGLSIVKRIIELHGGKLEIAPSAAGKGVALLVDLPRAAG
ncbi:MAG: two-component system OmpR family sensor histidine kinase QseC [Rhodocyclaceae bacterium]|nr:MAG: two-component system OmpR family sensor histidine kinase QseC [Rhodocyclaceae bacterium]TND00731.1 MAG: two-component system, OmpR family, sensor histidine kinase QseC [Rhodocyclaceae bacterium]